MRNLKNIACVCGLLMLLGLGCSQSKEATTNTNQGNISQRQTNSTTKEPETQIELTSKALTKAYEENEIAADEKYKNKLIKVSGKITDIAETLGNVTVQLEGHKFLQNVMCSFEESEKGNVAKLKKGQQTTFVGRGDGKTLGLYVGLQTCKIQ
jgi:tRNA_anti-like